MIINADGCVISGNLFDNCWRCVTLDASYGQFNGSTVSHNRILNGTGSSGAILVYGNDHCIAHNLAQNSVQGFVYQTGGTGNTYTHNSIISCGQSGHYPIRIVAGNGASICGNRIKDTPSHGIYIDNASDVDITANQLEDIGYSGISVAAGTDITIADNTLLRVGASAQQAIEFTGTGANSVENAMVLNNSFIDCPDVCVHFLGGASGVGDNNQVSSNRFVRCGSSGDAHIKFTDDGTTTGHSVCNNYSDKGSNSYFLDTGGVAATAMDIVGNTLSGYSDFGLTGTNKFALGVRGSYLETGEIDAYKGGMYGDGTTNDAPALQAVLDGCVTYNCGRVTFPCREYLINSQVNFPATTSGRQWLVLECNGSQFTTTTGSITVLARHISALSDAVDGNYFVPVIRDLLMYGVSSSNAMSFHRYGRLNLENVRISSFNKGVELVFCISSRLNGVHCIGCEQSFRIMSGDEDFSDGTISNSNSNVTRLDNCRAQTSSIYAIGYYLSHSGNVTLQNCICEGSSVDICVHIDNVTTGGTSSNRDITFDRLLDRVHGVHRQVFRRRWQEFQHHDRRFGHPLAVRRDHGYDRSDELRAQLPQYVHLESARHHAHAVPSRLQQHQPLDLRRVHRRHVHEQREFDPFQRGFVGFRYLEQQPCASSAGPHRRCLRYPQRLGKRRPRHG